jgi:hypothetical protein
MRSVAVLLKGDEPRFLKWAKSVGLARLKDYRDWKVECVAETSRPERAVLQTGWCQLFSAVEVCRAYDRCWVLI